MQLLLTTLNAKYIHINLAIRLLYQLNKNHVGLAWREFTIKENPHDIAMACLDFEVVAFSCYIWNITQTLEVASHIKALNPNIQILLGGPEVSYDWKEIIALPYVDYIIVGEGETPFQQFLTQYPHVQNIPNFVFKQENQPHYLPDNTIFDLKQYQNIMPYADDDAQELRNRVLYIETSRGCPYKCEFCLASLDNKVRYLPTETIKAHLLYMMENGKVIKFLDRTFNIKRDFTLEIFRFILEHHRPENVFQFEITADILHPEIILFIQEHVPKGLFRFEIGIQTVNQSANLAVSRRQNFEKTKSIIQALSDKVEMHLDLIVGLALDYWADIKYSFEETFKLFPPELQLGFLKFLKGTPVRYKHEQHGFVFDPQPPYQIIRSNYLSENELADIEILENALEIYWNKKRTPLTLKYIAAKYSIFDFLLGLGKHFATQRAFHRYGLEDVYRILAECIQKNYTEDSILYELLALDYYHFHKVKPKTWLLPELERAEKNRWVSRLKLNLNKYRYVFLPLSFDFDTFERENRIHSAPDLYILSYTGTTKPQRVGLEKLERS